MSLVPKSQIGHLVYFPKCGVYPLITGTSLWLNSYSPQCCIGDLVACPGPGVVITGDPLCRSSFRPTSGIGDICVSPVCGTGVIISGSPILR